MSRAYPAMTVIHSITDAEERSDHKYDRSWKAT